MNMMLEFNNKLKIILLIAILFIGVVGKAQFRLMVTPSLEIPIVFQGNPGYNSTFGIKAGGFYEWKKISLGLSVGYHSFSSSEGTLHKVGLYSFQLDSDPDLSSSALYGAFGGRSCDTCAYTEKFGNLTMIPILIEWNRYLVKTEKIKLSIGINAGFRFYSYSHVIRFDEPLEKTITISYNYYPTYPTTTQPELVEGVITTDKTDTRFNVSPKIAFEYLLTNKFSLYFEPAINLQTESLSDFFMLNDSFFETVEHTPNGYTVNTMFTSSLAVGFIYNFGYPTKVAQRKEAEKKQSESEKVEWIEN